MKTIPVFGIGYLNLSQQKHFLPHLCSRLKRKGGLGLTRKIGSNLSTVLQEHQKISRRIYSRFVLYIKLYYRFSVIIFGASSAKRAMFMPSLLTHKAQKLFGYFNFYPAILRKRLNRSMVSIQRGCGKGLAESRLRPLRNTIRYSIAHDQIVVINGFLHNTLIIKKVQNAKILRYSRQSQWKF